MPKFVTIGYGDQEGYDRTPVAIRNAAHAHDSELQKDGVLMGIAGTPIQVRNHGAVRTETAPGPFMQSPLPVAGFAIIEAADMAEAIAMVSQTPCAVAHGVVEVWPLEQP
ncbi:transcription initiation protein [Achromobacter sp. ACM03]|uniref:YciI family protein n=1 Tax=Achromobacter sp. ACM03 TaxID=2769300 RepID=UPI001780C6AF|nr:YciI family protein [Achromobacter sp. ACM03]MBD9429518.1 transcription initiation protein [Achromobacter sp. ACM03]